MDRYREQLEDCVRKALLEDLGGDLGLERDCTTARVAPVGGRAMARIFSRAVGVVAGTDAAVVAFELLDPTAEVAVDRCDGSAVADGDQVLTASCSPAALLAAERTALNFLQRLSGVASATRAMVDAVAGTKARILDTRKTTPGLRFLEKRAVVAGGGENHRAGLYDQILLKENHFSLGEPATYIEIVRRCAGQARGPVVVEACTIEQAQMAVEGGASVVLLDNFEPGAELRAAVAAVRKAAEAVNRPVEVEVSGGITLANVADYAACGVDRISVGALTHSAPSHDLSMFVVGHVPVEGGP